MKLSTTYSYCSVSNELDTGDGTTTILHIGSTQSNAAVVVVDTPTTLPTKSIGLIGSFALIANTCSGPAIGAFPLLFQQAGIIPVIVTIALIFIISTLSSTLLADAISKLPGNRRFNKSVSYSHAFRIVMGDGAYILAESLFLISCGVQAVAAIVAVAQSIDSLLASLIIGHTYALQVLPSIQLLSWSPELCDGRSVISEKPSTCSPFNDDDSTLLISLGFVITTAIFFPFGRGHLKETIALQVAIFMLMILLLIEFNTEFISRGLSVEIPWFGSDLSNVAGVVLFNYGFIVGVPAWLAEKESDVSVNAVLWSSTSFSSICYIVFGILGAMSFHNVDDNAMVMLTSTQVHYATRISAALFSILTIGCAIPIYCVLIRIAVLQATASKMGMWSAAMTASFIGAWLPYLIAWTLYKGHVLIILLKWAGLVVNGLVCYVLPLLLVFKALSSRQEQYDSIGYDDEEADEEEEENDDSTSIVSLHQNPSSRSPSDAQIEGGVYPLPSCLDAYRKIIVIFMMLVIMFLMAQTLVLEATMV